MPLYETALDLSNEAEVAALLAARWGQRPVKLDALHPYDYAFYDVRGVPCCHVEIKCRNSSYATYRISLQKWRRMLEFSRRTGVPGALVIRWPVGGAMKLLLAPVIPRPHGIVMGGRRDRGNPLDIEEMVEIPVSEFEDLNPDENVSRETV